MPEDVYEVLSLGMRYWFILLGVLIVWRAFGWLRKDRREKHRRLRQLPDAGMIGELVVLVGSDELPEGTVIPVPREGVLGFLRTCDVVVPVPGVQDHHLDFSFRNGQGLLIQPWRGCTCQVDADEMDHHSKPRRYPMHHGSRLFVGDAVLRLRVFAGLDVQRHVAYMEDDAPDIPETQEHQGQQPSAVPEKWLGPDPQRVRQIGYPPERWGNQPEAWQPYQQDAPYAAPAEERTSPQPGWSTQPEAWQMYQQGAPYAAPAEERTSTQPGWNAQPEAWQMYQQGASYAAPAEERTSTQPGWNAQPEAWQPYQQGAPYTAPAEERASTQPGWNAQPEAWQPYQQSAPYAAPAEERASAWPYRDAQSDAWPQDPPAKTDSGQEDDWFDGDVNGEFDYAAPRVRRRRRSRDET